MSILKLNTPARTVAAPQIAQRSAGLALRTAARTRTIATRALLVPTPRDFFSSDFSRADFH